MKHVEPIIGPENSDQPPPSWYTIHQSQLQDIPGMSITILTQALVRFYERLNSRAPPHSAWVNIVILARPHLIRGSLVPVWVARAV